MDIEANEDKSTKWIFSEDDEISSTFKRYSETFSQLVALNNRLSSGPKGSYLHFEVEGGEPIRLRKKDLNSANAWFTRTIKDMKNYVKFARKRAKKPGDPSSLKGTYTPVFLGPALKAFYNNAPAKAFGTIHPMNKSEKTNLMDKLTYAKKGYILRNTIISLFYRYVQTQNLLLPEDGRQLRPDEHMNKCFGGTIPAVFLAFPEGSDGDKPEKELNTKKMNTYQILQSSQPYSETTNEDGKVVKKGFETTDHYQTFFFACISSLNQYSKDNLEELGMKEELASIEDPIVREAMLKEHNMVIRAGLEWQLMNNKIKEKEYNQKIARLDAMN
jgi:hypothetical protein